MRLATGKEVEPRTTCTVTGIDRIVFRLGAAAEFEDQVLLALAVASDGFAQPTRSAAATASIQAYLPQVQRLQQAGDMAGLRLYDRSGSYHDRLSLFCDGNADEGQSLKAVR